MKIITGLEPRCSSLRIPRSFNDRFAHHVGEGVAVVDVDRDLGVDVWALQLRTAVDSVDHRAGTVRASMLLATMPTIVVRREVLSLYDDLRDLEGYEAHVRAHQGIPVDAVVTDERREFEGLTLRELKWWEVTA